MDPLIGVTLLLMPMLAEPLTTVEEFGLQLSKSTERLHSHDDATMTCAIFSRINKKALFY